MCASAEGCPFQCCMGGVISTCSYPINTECNSLGMIFTRCGGDTCVGDGETCPTDAGVDAPPDGSTADAATDAPPDSSTADAATDA
ncbi:MAG: hypothetical protein GXP55_05025 [Deltaproteobacteria bacterium]|nr:hypothetical protein [Deltaproteobacteria bacterium]